MQPFPVIRLAIPARVAAPFDHPDWVFELKMDGCRSLAHIGDGRWNLVSRKNNVYKSFPTLCAELAGLRVKNAVLDGEIVCLDEDGRSQFYELLHRLGQQPFMPLICSGSTARICGNFPWSGGNNGCVS
jgi:ATP-dependent DNA ligase